MVSARDTPYTVTNSFKRSVKITILFCYYLY